MPTTLLNLNNVVDIENENCWSRTTKEAALAEQSEGVWVIE